MAHPTKISMPVAVSNRSNFTLDIPHVTTSNFMEFGISFAKEYVPGSNWDLSQETFMRLEPMPVPTFGEAEVKHRAFFVPFRTVFPAFIDFSEGSPHVYNNGESSIPQFVPVLYDADITRMFVDYYTTRLSGDESSDPRVVADFTLDLSGGIGTSNIAKFNLTPLGRRVYKMFVSLGMKFTFSLSTRGYVSALPLFCAGRIYLDWFYTSQYAHTSGYTAIQKYLIRNDDVVDVGESFVPITDLRNICSTLSNIFYEPDYFTSAWDNPTGPNMGLESSIKIPDISGDPSQPNSFVQYTNSTPDSGRSSYPTLQGDDGYLHHVSNYLITAVKKLGDYVKRNQLAGARALDRFYARFGIQIPAEALNRSYLVGEFSHYIKFGDVTSMASTESATLGDYAGKGVTYGNGNFKFSGKERGYFIVITSIIPKTYYYQGVDRMAHHVSKLDFWTEEFDGLGVQVLSKEEVYKPQDSLTDSMMSDDYNDKVFGFVPRYAEYKTSSAILSGDYILRSRNVGKDAWTLFRNVRPDHSEPLDEFKHDIHFVSGNDANQYNRIFYNTSENADHFNVIHQFRLKVSFPGKSLYDTYEFDNEENSKRVAMGIGGTQLS